MGNLGQEWGGFAFYQTFWLPCFINTEFAVLNVSPKEIIYSFSPLSMMISILQLTLSLAKGFSLTLIGGLASLDVPSTALAAANSVY